MDTAPWPIVTIIKRELLTSLRSWKSFVLLLLLMAVLFYAAHVTMQTSAMYASAANAMTYYFQIQTTCLYLVAMTIVPAMAAVSVNSERESDNWELLATTLIPPSRIILGKYLAVLAVFVLFCVAVLPLTGLVYFYAGVDRDQLLVAILWIAPAALGNAAIGVWASCTYEKLSHAITRTFSVMFLLAVLFLLLPRLYRVLAVTALGQPGIFGAWPGYAAFQLAAGAAFLAVALYGVRHRDSGLAAAAHAASVSVQQARQRLFPPSIIRIPDGANPFGYRDLCGSESQNKSAARIGFIVTAFCYLGIATALAWNFPGAESGMGVLDRVLILFLVPPMVAIAVAKERNETTMDMYRMTLQPGAAFFWGKALGFLRQFRPALLAVLACKITLLFLFASPAWQTPYGPPMYLIFLDLLTLPVHLLMTVCTALAGALFPRSTIAAIGAAYGGVFGGLLFFLYLQAELGFNGRGSDVEEFTSLTVSHLVLCGLALGTAVGIGTVRASNLWDARN